MAKVLLNTIYTGIIGLLMMVQAHAGIPLWTFSTPHPASLTLSASETSSVQYIVTNHSRFPKNLLLKPSPGLSASPCLLAKQGSTCNLIITINGSKIPNIDIHSGPILCQADPQGNPDPTQCYRPAQGNELNVTLTQLSAYTITPIAGANGSISPNTPQAIASGNNSPLFTATPDANYIVSGWMIDGSAYSACGTDTTCQLTNVTADHTISVSFVAMSPRYVYIANTYNSSPEVSLCTLNPINGTITSCIDAGGESVFSGIPIQGILVNNLGTIAYLSNGNGSSSTPYAYQCQIDPVLHTFSSCTTTTVTVPTGYTPYEGLLGINSTNTMIYFTDSNGGRILACPITEGIISGSCTNTGAIPISTNVAGVAINKASTTAYLGNYNNPIGVNICSVNGSIFSSCLNKTGGNINGTPFLFQSAAGIVLNNTESTIYIADLVASITYGCSVAANNTTSFDSCFIANSTVPAYNIVLNAGNTMAYITTYSGTTYSCSILVDGTFPVCTSFTVPGSTTGLALLY